MNARFKGKVALITGAAQGIGRAAALQFAREGAHVAILHLAEAEQAARAAEAVREIGTLGAEAVAHAVDVVDHAGVAACAARVAERFGRIDIAVTCAGVLSHTPVVELTEAEWDRVIAVNLKGTYNVIHAVAPIMVKQGSGRIVTIGSQQTITGKGRAAYLAAKSGVIGLTKAAARELGPSGINVNCIAPGPTDTELMRSFAGVDDAYIAALPLKRLGRPQDIADAIAYLASDEAAYFCGQVLSPNGGIAM